MTPDRRLIEDFIPIREISVEATREKSIRKGHISTLHLWWARRPLVAARAAVFASLVTAPETYQKRTALKKTMIDLCRWEAGEVTIADARLKILEAQRERLGLPADTPLKDVPPPKVLDMFAGSRAIPLESLRLGCETYAVDLNPVAHIIELCTLVYPQQYGKKLAEEVEKWGNWVIDQVRQEIGDLYPRICPHPLAPSPQGEGGANWGEGGARAEDVVQLSILGGKGRQIPDELLERARELRRQQTPTEKILWECLRNRRLHGAKFRRQHNIESYIADFYCHEARLVVEVDGLIHNRQQDQDANGDQWFTQHGFTVLRFKNQQIEQDLETVLTTIATHLPFSPSPLSSSSPLSSGRGAGGEGLTPVAYLWTRTVKCSNPACGAQVPLVRQTWLCKKKDKYVALKTIPNHETKRVEFEVVESKTEQGLGFDPALGSARGTSTCRHCGATVKSDVVKEQEKADKMGQQLMAIVCTTAGEKGKTYLSGDRYQHYVPDDAAIQARLERLCQETGLTVPSEPIFSADTRAFFTHLYGLDTFGKLFTTRQLLALMTFVKWVRLAHEKMMQQGYDEEFGKAISTYLAGLLDQVSNRCNALCTYDPSPTQSGIQPVFSRQALPMIWDFCEGRPIGDSSGSASNSLPWMLNFLTQEGSQGEPAFCQRRSAMNLSFEPESLDAVITDPPYFDAVPYADLSDFFYVWLKRSLGHLYSEHFSGQLTPKKNEAIMEPSRHGGDKQKAARAYEEMMHQAFCEASRVLKPNGMMVFVYAHKTTAGWASLIDSLRRAKFTIAEAWHIDTERPGGLRGLRASLASSIFLVARKRKGATVGDYAMNVKPELSQIFRERVSTLMAEGVTGADLVIACIGAGLRAYTQYERVELPNGEELDATSFLDEVQKEVVKAVLTSVMQCDRQGVSLVVKPTQYYIMGRYEYGELAVEFDEANTLAKGVGVELDGVGGLTEGKLALVKKVKTTIQLRDYSERGASEDLGIQRTEGRQTFNVKLQPVGSAPTLIDILHRLLWLAEHKPSEIPNFLSLAQPDATQLRLVAQALAGRALTPEPGQENAAQRTKEQAAIDTLLASWKRLVEDNLFTQGR
jgi:putative DNA methylase